MAGPFTVESLSPHRVLAVDEDDELIQVRINGVDVFHPTTGEVRSDSADGVACWFIDTDCPGQAGSSKRPAARRTELR